MSWERELFPALETWVRFRATNPERHQLRDALWRAACHDAQAKDLLSEGHTRLALEAWREARRIEDVDLDGEMLSPAEEARWQAILAEYDRRTRRRAA